MKKTLVTVDNLQEHVCRTSNTLCVDCTMLVTPGAKDELARQGIAIVYGNDRQNAACHTMAQGSVSSPLGAVMGGNTTTLEGLLMGLAAILKKEYGVTDPEQLKKLSLQALQTIKNNI